MSEQQPKPTIPTRPKINPWLLWTAILLPIGFMGAMTLVAMIYENFEFVPITLFLGPVVIFVGWVLLGVALFKRVSTGGYVGILIGYAALQIVVCFALFFVGCLSSLGGNWGHSAPDSWLEEQERLKRENPIDPEELEKAKRELDEHLKRQEELEKTTESAELLGEGRDLQQAGEGIPAAVYQQQDEPNANSDE